MIISVTTTYHPHPGDKAIRNPDQPEMYLDHCTKYDWHCNQPAADLFCQRNGFLHAAEGGWAWENVKAQTRMIAADPERAVCAGDQTEICGAFTKIVCIKFDCCVKESHPVTGDQN